MRTSLHDCPAPAKLNLFLHVTGRRPDGYHLLQTVFQLLDHGDTLHFDLRMDGAIRRTTDVAGVPAASDLIVRAAQLLQQAASARFPGRQFGADVAIIKRLPLGGGLGGGSSDAATTLMALNHLWQTGLTRPELMTLGLFSSSERMPSLKAWGRNCRLWRHRQHGMSCSNRASASRPQQFFRRRI